MSKAPSFKPEGLSSLPVSPGPELVTVVRGLRNETLDAHTEPEARTRLLVLVVVVVFITFTE